jgi:hypothetical protein
MKERPTRSAYVFLAHVSVVRSAGPEWTDVEPGRARAFPHPPDRGAPGSLPFAHLASHQENIHCSIITRPVCPENATAILRSPPSEMRSGRWGGGGERLLPPVCLKKHLPLSFSRRPRCSPAERADERRCGFGAQTSAESEEKRCLKPIEEDFP